MVYGVEVVAAVALCDGTRRRVAAVALRRCGVVAVQLVGSVFPPVALSPLSLSLSLPM